MIIHDYIETSSIHDDTSPCMSIYGHAWQRINFIHGDTWSIFSRDMFKLYGCCVVFKKRLRWLLIPLNLQVQNKKVIAKNRILSIISLPNDSGFHQVVSDFAIFGYSFYKKLHCFRIILKLLNLKLLNKISRNFAHLLHIKKF